MDGVQLAKARQAKGWSLREAAKHVGVDYKTLHNWEKGKAAPHGYNRKRLEEVYGIFLASASCVTSVELENIPVFVFTDLTMHLQSLAFTPFALFKQVQNNMRDILEEFDAMGANDTPAITRRDALRRVVTLPFVASNLRYAYEDILSQCAASIAACWELGKSNDHADFKLAFESASLNLSLLDIILHSSSYQQQAAELSAQAAMIKTVLGWHLESARDAARYAKQAIEYSKNTNDIPLQIAAWKYLAWACIYDPSLKGKALETMKQVILLLKNNRKAIPMALYGNVYSALACMQARTHQSSLEALNAAEKTIPHSDNEDNLLPLITMHTAMALYAEGDYENATRIISSIIDIETLITKDPFFERRRLEIINAISAAYLRQANRDMEKAIHFWQTGMEGARALQSEQRFSESVNNYAIMSALWPNEERIKKLRPLISHW